MQPHKKEYHKEHKTEGSKSVSHEKVSLSESALDHVTITINKDRFKKIFRSVSIVLLVLLFLAAYMGKLPGQSWMGEFSLISFDSDCEGDNRTIGDDAVVLQDDLTGDEVIIEEEIIEEEIPNEENDNPILNDTDSQETDDDANAQEDEDEPIALDEIDAGDISFKIDKVETVVKGEDYGAVIGVEFTIVNKGLAFEPIVVLSVYQGSRLYGRKSFTFENAFDGTDTFSSKLETNVNVDKLDDEKQVKLELTDKLSNSFATVSKNVKIE